MNSNYQINLEVNEAFSDLVDSQNIAAAVEEVLRLTGKESATVTVAITDDEEIHQLNLTYRGVDAPTDVLSFASQAEETTEQALVLPPELAEEMVDYLGDIVIAYPYAARQAERFQNSVAAELRLLAIHGTLHLLGNDHATPQDEAAMWALQDTALAAFGDRGLSQRVYDA
jgi:probable rRNA maturation factor